MTNQKLRLSRFYEGVKNLQDRDKKLVNNRYSILFSGEEGIGKTRLCLAFAQKYEIYLIRPKASLILGKNFSHATKALAEIFEQAKKASNENKEVMILWESLELFALDGRNKASYEYRFLAGIFAVELSSLYEESYKVINVGLTSSISFIDPSIQDIFSLTLNFPLPDNSARRTAWENHLARIKKSLSEDYLEY